MSSENNQNKENKNSNIFSSYPILASIDSIVKLEKFLNQNKIENEYLDIDILFRYYIKSENLKNIFLLFIPHLEINFQNKYFNNSTILMFLISENLFNFTEELIDNFLDDVNLTLTDNLKENIFFKILNLNNEQNKYSLFKKAFETLNNEEKKTIISSKNLKEESLLEKALLIGNVDITNLLIKEDKINYKNNLSEDNILHFAIKGKSPYCLKIILNNLSNDLFLKFLNEKNKNNETPIQLANKLNLNSMIKLLNDLKNNNKEENNSEKEKLEINQVINLLCDLNDKNFNQNIEMIKNNFYLNDWNLIFIEKLVYEQKEKKLDFDLLKKIVDFFDEDIKYNKDKEIYFLNYMTEAYNFSDFSEMLSIFKNYLDNKTEKNDNIFFINSIIMLIEKSLSYQLNNFSKSLIQLLIKFISNFSNEENNKIPLDYIKYLNKKEILNSNENLKELISLYQCYLNINESNYDKAQENLSEFKSKISLMKNNENPIYKTLISFYHILKVRIDYFNNTQFKFFQHLSKFSSNKEIDSIIFYYNSMGIAQLKQKRYFYAEYCFKYCEKLIRQNEINYYLFLNTVLYNISLCYFYSKKYEKCYKILSNLKNVDSMSTNPFLFYRLGLCCLEIELQNYKNSFNEDNLNDLVNETLFSSENENVNFKKRFILINKNPSKISDYDNNNEKLNEAIFAFKQALLIIKGKTFYNKEIYNLFNNNKEIELNYNIINNNITDNNTFQYSQIFSSIYLNLIFCLIRNENYTEAIETILEFKNYDSNNNFQYVIDNYLIECYIRINEYSKALEILSKQNFSYDNIDMKGNFFTSGNNLIYSEVSFKLSLCINIIKIQLLNNNFQEAEKNINSMISLLNYPSELELPSFVLNIILYYLLITNKNDLAIETLKHRKIPKFIYK